MRFSALHILSDTQEVSGKELEEPPLMEIESAVTLLESHNPRAKFRELRNFSIFVSMDPVSKRKRGGVSVEEKTMRRKRLCRRGLADCSDIENENKAAPPLQEVDTHTLTRLHSFLDLPAEIRDKIVSTDSRNMPFLISTFQCTHVAFILTSSALLV